MYASTTTAALSATLDIETQQPSRVSKSVAAALPYKHCCVTAALALSLPTLHTRHLQHQLLLLLLLLNTAAGSTQQWPKHG
jgi:hypothetical protein